MIQEQEASMTNITTIGLDLAKSVFQVHCADKDGRPVLSNSDSNKNSCETGRQVVWIGEFQILSVTQM